ncbi:hypothetical protein HRbin08_00047 [bacterium HR08]|nr:hypothetical protein HRbin08_00047 [bacterium HR08]
MRILLRSEKLFGIEPMATTLTLSCWETLLVCGFASKPEIELRRPAQRTCDVSEPAFYFFECHEAFSSVRSGHRLFVSTPRKRATDFTDSYRLFCL